MAAEQWLPTYAADELSKCLTKNRGGGLCPKKLLSAWFSYHEKGTFNGSRDKATKILAEFVNEVQPHYQGDEGSRAKEFVYQRLLRHALTEAVYPKRAGP